MWEGMKSNHHPTPQLEIYGGHSTWMFHDICIIFGKQMYKDGMDSLGCVWDGENDKMNVYRMY